jgi:hypothetical protein
MRAWLEDLGHVCPLAVGEDFPKIDVIVLADDLREEAIAFGRIYKTPVMAWEDAMCWVAHHDRFLDGPLAGKPVPSGVMPHWRRFEYLMPPRSRGISLRPPEHHRLPADSDGVRRALPLASYLCAERPGHALRRALARLEI